MSFEIRRDDLTDPQVVELVRFHRRESFAVTPAGSAHAFDPDDLRRSEVTFWSVWSDGELAGCGALQELAPDHGEVKSMRTAPGHLRRGIAARLLDHLLAEAKRRGYARVSLETGAGAPFAPARQLYERAGFRPCGPFATYRDDPNTVFMALELA